MTSLDGTGLWVFYFPTGGGGPIGGTPLSAPDAAAYKAAGVDWVAVKVSDGIRGGGQVVIDQIGVVQGAGMRVIPWGFLYGSLPAQQQLQVLKAAAGGGFQDAILDIEETVDVVAFSGFDQMACALCSWGNPDQHPDAPSIGLFNDIGITAQLPQAYPGAWQVSPSQAIATASGQYRGIVPTPPLCPVSDQGSTLLAFAEAAKAAGCSGISAWRHGANGISPASFSGVAAVFAPPVPAPPAPPAPDPAPVPASPIVLGPGTYQAASVTITVAP